MKCLLQLAIMPGPSCPLGWVLLQQACLYTGETPGGHSWRQALTLCTDIEESKGRPGGDIF